MTDWQHLTEYRIVAVALLASAVIHGGLLLGLPDVRVDPIDLEAPAYIAQLVAEEPAPPAAAPAKAAPVRRARPRPSPPKPEETIAELPSSATPPEAEVTEAPAPESQAAPPPPVEAAQVPVEAAATPEKVALAEPSVPVPPPRPAELAATALPGKLSITYSLNSAFADGRAEYTWTRDGDRYAISGEAAATGIFAVFLEGQILQESVGTITAGGLRPDRFSERRPNTPEEGLAFDWAKGRVTFFRNDTTRTGPLEGNTVDWLSMIFQLAQLPPQGEAHELRVYTQRRLYAFTLRVVGLESIELPIGRVTALHLHHAGASPQEAVDVWLSPEHHNLPVKLRYPVARNRFHVEQLATSVTAR